MLDPSTVQTWRRRMSSPSTTWAWTGGRSSRPPTWRHCGSRSAGRFRGRRGSGRDRPGLAAAADPGLVATAGPRYFGFVIGGAQPAALAADWLTSAWDQNAAMYVMSPAAAVVEEVVEGWLLDVFGLPAGTSVGSHERGHDGRFTALAAARHRVLAEVGWAVEDRGLFGAPEVAVIVGAEAHVTIHAALQMLGLGGARRPGGRRRPGPDAGRRACRGRGHGPRAPDRVRPGGQREYRGVRSAPADRGRRPRPGRLAHVDGAFGLWAAAAPDRRSLVDGIGEADSWTTDDHKWLNVPYDSGVVMVRDRVAHRAAMTLGAAYYVETAGGERDGYNWVPDRHVAAGPSRSGRPCARSAATGWPTSWSAAAAWRRGWPTGSPRSPASRSSTRSCSTRSSSGSRRPARTAPRRMR